MNLLFLENVEGGTPIMLTQVRVMCAWSENPASYADFVSDFPSFI